MQKKLLKALAIGAAFTLIATSSFAQNVGIGTASPNVKLDDNGAFAMREGTALSLTTGANNNVSAGSNSFYRIIAPTGGAFSITGIAGGSDGRILILNNETG